MIVINTNNNLESFKVACVFITHWFLQVWVLAQLGRKKYQTNSKVALQYFCILLSNYTKCTSMIFIYVVFICIITTLYGNILCTINILILIEYYHYLIRYSHYLITPEFTWNDVSNYCRRHFDQFYRMKVVCNHQHNRNCNIKNSDDIGH